MYAERVGLGVGVGPVGDGVGVLVGVGVKVGVGVLDGNVGTMDGVIVARKVLTGIGVAEGAEGKGVKVARIKGVGVFEGITAAAAIVGKPSPKSISFRLISPGSARRSKKLKEGSKSGAKRTRPKPNIRKQAENMSKAATPFKRRLLHPGACCFVCFCCGFARRCGCRFAAIDVLVMSKVTGTFELPVA